MTAATEQFVCRVVGHDPRLAALLLEHLEDNDGQLLPHVLVGVLAARLDLQARTGGLPTDGVLGEFEAGLRATDLDVQEVVAVSFLENLDDDSPILSLLSEHARQVRLEVLHRH